MADDDNKPGFFGRLAGRIASAVAPIMGKTAAETSKTYDAISTLTVTTDKLMFGPGVASMTQAASDDLKNGDIGGWAKNSLNAWGASAGVNGLGTSAGVAITVMQNQVKQAVSGIANSVLPAPQVSGDPTAAPATPVVSASQSKAK
jgi:hypothetical protein